MVLTQQQVFDKVWNYFVVEKHEPATNCGDCYYRTEEGRKCAIGIFIPDEVYYEDMECCEPRPLVNLLLDMGYDELNGMDDNFLLDLRECHDFSAVYGDFCLSIKDSLTKLAENYGLQVPIGS